MNLTDIQEDFKLYKEVEEDMLPVYTCRLCLGATCKDSAIYIKEKTCICIECDFKRGKK